MVPILWNKYLEVEYFVLQAVELRNGSGTDNANVEQRKTRKKVIVIMLLTYLLTVFVDLLCL